MSTSDSTRNNSRDIIDGSDPNPNHSRNNNKNSKSNSHSTLPPIRVVLTSLINALASSSSSSAPSHSLNHHHPQNVPSAGRRNAAGDDTNPLRNLGPEKKKLVMTLHVIFPSLLLPALDLLERGCVRRVVWGGARDIGGNDDWGRREGVWGRGDGNLGFSEEFEECDGISGRNSGATAAAGTPPWPPPPGRPERPGTCTSPRSNQLGSNLNPSYPSPTHNAGDAAQAPQHQYHGQPRNHHQFYLVHSSRSSRSTCSFRSRAQNQDDSTVFRSASSHTTAGQAGRGASVAGGPKYLVRTLAWNCSCAAFALGAFPPSPPAGPAGDSDSGGVGDGRAASQADEGDEEQSEDKEDEKDEREHGEEHERGQDAGQECKQHRRRRRDGQAGVDELHNTSTTTTSSDTTRPSHSRNARTGKRGTARLAAPTQHHQPRSSSEAESFPPQQHHHDWQFGGLSLDCCSPPHSTAAAAAAAAAPPPLCKHLLACILAERWPDVLGRYVDASIVATREEVACLGGGDL